MEKSNFIEVLKHYAGSSENEALEVISLKESFPYSQLLQALSARVSKDHDFIDHQHQLQQAAVYAADRSVLKSVMTSDTLETIPAAVAAKPTAKKVETTLPQPPAPVITSDDQPDEGSLAEEVMHDLERLNELKHNFEAMFRDSGKPLIKSRHTNKPAAVEQEETAPQKSKRERIIELAKALESSHEPAPEESRPAEEPKFVVPRRRLNPTEAIIEEISSKEEIEPDSPKQKEQLEMIDQFIKTHPTISNPRDKVIAAPEGDLSTIKSGEFGDNIVSETLVEILVKQGKKDKAIEVLKKLIWKFPQKKAYFAAQIEDLKK